MKQAAKRRLIFGGLVLLLIVIAFGVYTTLIIKDISDVKTDEFVGKTIQVRGEVQNVIKIGDFSGYTLRDETGSLRVSTDDLPQEGKRVTVRGTLIHDTLFGYYLKV